MAEQPRSRRLLIAWGLLASAALLGLCLAGQESASAAAYPDPESDNLLGPAAGWLAGSLLDALGHAAYALVVGWGAVAVLLLIGRGPLRVGVRAVGWLLLTLVAAVGLDAVPLASLPGPLTGNGGALGALLSTTLTDHFEAPGRWAIVAGALLAGLLLAADAAVTWSLRSVWAGLRWTGLGLKNFTLFMASPSPVDPTPAPATSADGESIPIHHTNVEEEPVTPQPSAVPQLRIVRPGAADEDDRFDDYELPPLSLLEEAAPFPFEEHDRRLRDQATLLEKTFADFGLNVRVVGINTGPVISQYELALETGLRVNKVTTLGDDIALNLSVPSVRIVAPIPNKNTVGIEVPNQHRGEVRLKDIILAAGKKAVQSRIPLFLGKDTEGRPLVYDLAEMPHLLIAGRTGTGKSVCLNAIILSMLMTRRPDQVKMILVDPKGNEFIDFAKLPHLMHPVVKDAKKAEAILSWAVDKMEERYDLLSRARVRNVAAYNDLGISEILRRVNPADEEERRQIPDKMPYIVLVVDELGDLMMQMKREIESHIIRLAQKSRAAGIHLVVATQKPTVDVITGLIKSNLPARVCFQVSSRTDSRVVLDEMGADKLLGKGDMLFLQPGTSTIVRAQGTYASDKEITRVVEHLEVDTPCYAQELIDLRPSSGSDGGGLREQLRERDAIYEQAIEVIVREGRGSVSLLQRALGIGYGKAARLIDYMAEDGIVGPYNGSNARDVLVTPEDWEQRKRSG